METSGFINTSCWNRTRSNSFNNLQMPKEDHIVTSWDLKEGKGHLFYGRVQNNIRKENRW
jgi:hypothetical protein